MKRYNKTKSEKLQDTKRANKLIKDQDSKISVRLEFYPTRPLLGSWSSSPICGVYIDSDGTAIIFSTLLAHVSTPENDYALLVTRLLMLYFILI